MQPSALAEAREWLTGADEELAAAERLLQTPPPLLSIAAYHAQQAGQNALSAFLAAHGIAFRSTPNLAELLRQCQAIDASFGQLSLAAERLTPYAARVRHAGRLRAPTSLEAEEALQLADDVVQLVHKRLGL